MCLSAYFLLRKSPPAPVSSKTFARMVLFPRTVLLMMGIEMVIDFDPKLAISTEEILSVSNVVVGHSSKNPVLICLHTICLFPPDPCPQSNFRFELVLHWQSFCTLQISGSVSFLCLGSLVPCVLFYGIQNIGLLPYVHFVLWWIVCPHPWCLALSSVYIKE